MLDRHFQLNKHPLALIAQVNIATTPPSAMDLYSKEVDHAGATAEEVKPFRPLDLPPEIWSRIGKLVIDVIPEVFMCRLSLVGSADYYAPILRTCRVIREELLPYFWRSGLKVECFGLVEIEQLGDLLKHVGHDACGQMRGVRITALGHVGWEEVASSLRKGFRNIHFELGKGRTDIAETVWVEASQCNRERKLQTFPIWFR